MNFARPRSIRQSAINEVSRAVLPLLNLRARIPVCGLIAQYSAENLPPGPNEMPLLQMAILAKRLLLQGFIISEHMDVWPAALKELGEHPELGGKVQVLSGRYGPYVKHGKVNATIPKDAEPEKITMEEAVKLLEARAASGNVTASGEPGAEWDVNTSSGDIALRISSRSAFDLRASSASGRITTDHPLVVQGTFRSRRLEGQVRGGGPLVELRAASGSIRIE